MKLDLDELERLENAATPGDWFRGARDMTEHTIGTMADVVARLDFEYGDDADFIIALRNAAPQLLAEVRAARHVLVKLELGTHGWGQGIDDFRRLVAQHDGIKP